MWQEGHTVHATQEEAEKEVMKILEIYKNTVEGELAIPVVTGKKSEKEKFVGAVYTTTMESIMPDGKALQMGTSHFLGQNFARASGITFQTPEETESYAWTTSWGASTRLIGGLIMTHADDDGMILPPRVASSHVVLMPILRKESERQMVMEYTEGLARELRAVRYHDGPIRVEVDTRDIGGARGWDWIRKGIPLRVEIGPRDIAEDAVFVGRRDREHRDRTSIPRAEFVQRAPEILDDIQRTLYERALAYREANTVDLDDRDRFYAFFTPENPKKPEIHGGFVRSPWCGEEACEERIKADLQVTIRCIPFDASEASGGCIGCGKPGRQRAVFAKAY